MYILVEKDLATKKNKIIRNLENLWLSKSPFAIFKWMYLIVVDYPTEKKMLERLSCAAAPSTAQTREKSESQKSKELTFIGQHQWCLQVFVSFFPPKTPWAFVASFFQLNTEGLELSFQAQVSGRRSCTMSCCWGGRVFRRCGGEVWQNGTRESAGLWGCCDGGARHSVLSVPTSWVCIVRACCMLGMAPAGLLRHAGANTPQQPTWEELGC